MQRKRSAHVGFSMMALSAALIGCEQRQVQAPPAGGTEQAQVFTSAEACAAQGPTPDQCAAAEAAARAQHEQTAPQYASREQCEQEWSAGNCEATRASGGGSFFVPAMMGFFLGRAMAGGGGFGGSPVYGGRSGLWSGKTRMGDATMRGGRWAAPRTVAFAGAGASSARAARGGFGQSRAYSGGGGRGG